MTQGIFKACMEV